MTGDSVPRYTIRLYAGDGSLLFLMPNEHFGSFTADNLFHGCAMAHASDPAWALVNGEWVRMAVDHYSVTDPYDLPVTVYNLDGGDEIEDDG